MDHHEMFSLARALAEAKSRQDVPAALGLLHRDMVLETPAFGTVARGPAENARALTRFFASFPDYDVVLHGHATDGETLTCWGTASMTMTGDRFGVVPNGRRAEVPVFIRFTFADGLISGERFFFDLSALCAQSGVSTDGVRRRLFGERMGEVATAHLFSMTVDLEPRRNIGDGPYGRRVLFGAAGGSFEGPRVRGEVLAGGGDWALFRPDGAMALDVRLTLRTDDGALVHMTYGGRWIVPPELRADLADPAGRHRVDPARYYFRTNPLFETGAEPYAWLNDVVGAGSGRLVEGGIAYEVAQIL
jgi:ketosteroid isomerase-like protein